MRLILLLLTSLFAIPLDLTAQKKLGILGSSTAAGTGASPVSNSWVNRITAKYQAEGLLSSTVNLAVSGYNPYHAMPSSRTPPPASRPAPVQTNNVTQLMINDPDIVIISFVSNNFDSYSTAEIQNTLTEIRDSAIKAGAVCFVTTTQPRTGFSVAGRARLKELRDLIISWFGEYAIDFYTPLADPADNTIKTEYRSTDDIHINNAGHEQLFNQVVAKNIFSFTLPVKLERFHASLINSKPTIEWSVSDEETYTEYELLRSNNGRNFETIFTLKAQGKTHYSYRDEKAEETILYYRLRMIEYERQLLSEVVMVQPSGFQSRISIFPNPSSGSIVVEMNSKRSEPVSMIILNLVGQPVRVIRRAIINGRNQFEITLNGLAPGNYYLKAQFNDHSTTTPFIRK